MLEVLAGQHKWGPAGLPVHLRRLEHSQQSMNGCQSSEASGSAGQAAVETAGRRVVPCTAAGRQAGRQAGTLAVCPSKSIPAHLVGEGQLRAALDGLRVLAGQVDVDDLRGGDGWARGGEGVRY